jgi:hypothetical protein
MYFDTINFKDIHQVLVEWTWKEATPNFNLLGTSLMETGRWITSFVTNDLRMSELIAVVTV